MRRPGVLRSLLLLIIHCYYWLLEKTVRVEVRGRDAVIAEVAQGRSPIVACAHHALLPCVLSFGRHPATLIASLSKDGELIAHVLEKRNFQVVRGSSSRGGAAALQKLLDASAKGRCIGITFDGPRGPPLVPKKGVAVLAEHSSGSAYFVKIRPRGTRLFPRSFSVLLGSWDRFLLPLPFCRLVAEYVLIPVPKPLRRESENDVDDDVDGGTTADVIAERGRYADWQSEFLSELERLARAAYGFLYENERRGRVP